MTDRAVIVVGVDGSDESMNAVRWAVREATRSDASLRLVRAWHSHSYFGSPFFINPIPELVREPEETAHHDVSRAQDLVGALAPALEVSVCTPGGPSAMTLLSHTSDAAMVVIGGKHRPMIERAFYGSVTTHAVTHAHCPVVVVRGALDEPEAAAGRRGRVVVGFDNSDEARSAASFAFAYAAYHGLDIAVVEALAVPPEVAPTLGDDVLGLYRDAIIEVMSNLVAQHPTVAMTAVTAVGHPVPVLLENAGDADLLVVGSRGRGRFEGMLLGSVSAALVHQSPVTLLVLR